VSEKIQMRLPCPAATPFKIQAPGFKAFSVPPVSLAAGDRARVDAKLQVGETSETVTVQAQAPALQTDSSTPVNGLGANSGQKFKTLTISSWICWNHRSQYRDDSKSSLHRILWRSQEWLFVTTIRVDSGATILPCMSMASTATSALRRQARHLDIVDPIQHPVFIRGGEPKTQTSTNRRPIRYVRPKEADSAG
jgi:hypothetical protein